MKKVSYLLFAIFMVGSLVLAACGGTPEQQNPESRPAVEPTSAPVSEESEPEMNDTGCLPEESLVKCWERLDAEAYAITEDPEVTSLDMYCQYGGNTLQYGPWNVTMYRGTDADTGNKSWMFEFSDSDERVTLRGHNVIEGYVLEHNDVHVLDVAPSLDLTIMTCPDNYPYVRYTPVFVGEGMVDTTPGAQIPNIEVNFLDEFVEIKFSDPVNSVYHKWHIVVQENGNFSVTHYQDFSLQSEDVVYEDFVFTSLDPQTMQQINIVEWQQGWNYFFIAAEPYTTR